ncbi:hypothetical protein [Streptococcus equi]|uniref:hypothetical protein n=1 Tax=Streptococcus equi TaxID=1336 RepID=UPI001BB78030|nr:hypothetical protein [Streptococcus equi]MCD3385010.1 hypothetical protein [Streptococcus equi subsp. zooepidemicus]MCD3393389.1 hypothetical protein [Streptococcus equi subsp. zooepidemicus]QTR95002.1 hypothetical protein HCFMJIKG_00227 [Streptococcus equi subsp. zooepidemicus]HEL0698988.1 hypothetical protein [Streptococcus equi subsp. zooepidemicus]HEL0747471.1 hypothetical protein [Streptococcus equi subsp. zooepidemicus]
MKHVFKYHKGDILGYLNIVGFTLLFYGSVIGMIMFRDYLTYDGAGSLISTFILVSGTYHSVKSTFPYEGKRHPTFILTPYYLFKHLLLSVTKVYAFQIRVVTIGIICLAIAFPEQLVWIALSVLAVFIYWLSLPLVAIFRVAGRLLNLLMIYGMYLNQELLVIACLCLNVVILVLNVTINVHYPYQWLAARAKKTENTITLLRLVVNMITDHLALMVLFSIFCIAVTYFTQRLLLSFDYSSFSIPVFFLSASTYIALLEVMVGKNIKELELDRGLAVLQFLNRDISVYKAYRNSQFLLSAHILAVIHTGCAIGLLPFLLNGQAALFLSNLVMIPFIYFISFCYFVKSIKVVADDLSVFRWVILVLYFILVVIAMVGSRL